MRRLAVHAIAKVVSVVQEVVHLQNEDLPHLTRNFEQTKYGLPNESNKPSSPAIEDLYGKSCGVGWKGASSETRPDTFSLLQYVFYIYTLF